MKCFWYSLIGFCLLMCSCKSSKVDSSVQIRDEVQSETSYMNESIKVDTTKTTYTEQITENKVIKETIITEEYDKDTGALTKKTKTERETRQGSDKVVAEEENQNVTERNGLKVDHFEDKHEMVDTEVEEEKTGGQESFGKYLGIIVGISIVILILFLYLKNKSRVSKLFRSS